MSQGSGPPYPLPPPPTGIGEGFKIGVSPIGTPPPFDVWQTIVSQYANSATLTQLILNMFQYIDQTANLDAFYDNIWNILTAQGIGLDIWGRIVGVVRQLQVTGGAFFGFTGPDGASGDSFDAAPFFNGQPLTSSFALSDNAFRMLILAKALANICDGSIPAINQLLRSLFPGRGNVYVADLGNMQMQYVFTFPITAVEQAIVQQSGVLPRPTGVQATVVVQTAPPPASQPQLPFNNYDWPLPRRHEYPNSLRTISKRGGSLPQ